MKIIRKIAEWLVITLICTVKISRESIISDQLDLLIGKMCPEQCICSFTEMLCPGANITKVLNNGIDFQVLHWDLSDMSLNSIPEEVKLMTNCKKLNLSANNIRSVDKFFLDNLWNLEELVLSDNSVEDISDINPNDLLNNNNNFKVLNLSDNPLTHLGRDLRSILVSESLQVLDVSRCRIESLVGPIVLGSLPKLTYLDLSFNPLARLDGLHSNTLKILNVRGCSIGHLANGDLAGLKSLEVLDTSQNDRLYLDNAVYSATLKNLDVSQCSIRKPDLGNMAELRSAFLNGNRIRRLAARQFVNNTKLLTLDMSKNNIETVDPLAFYGLSSLVYLDLSSNMITDLAWETPPAALPSLEVLNLSRNWIARIGRLRSTTLRRLDLSYCWIQSVPDGAFAQLTELADLVLANNPLQSLLPGSLNSSRLATLDLSYCRLSHVKAYEFVSLPNLTELRLTGNRLVTLKNGTFNKCPKLKSVYLDDNPWRCECYSPDFAYMVRLANRTGHHSPADRSPRCQSPENVTGVAWYTVCGVNGPAYGRDNRKNFSMAVGVILILCVSGLMAIFVAVHENMKTRQAMRRRRRLQLDDYDGVASGGRSGSGGHDEYSDEFAAESMRKLSQLPSYDEAVMLPKPTTEHASRRGKRHSCTQTDGTVASTDEDPAAVDCDCSRDRCDMAPGRERRPSLRHGTRLLSSTSPPQPSPSQNALHVTRL